MILARSNIHATWGWHGSCYSRIHIQDHGAVSMRNHWQYSLLYLEQVGISGVYRKRQGFSAFIISQGNIIKYSNHLLTWHGILDTLAHLAMPTWHIQSFQYVSSQPGETAVQEIVPILINPWNHVNGSTRICTISEYNLQLFQLLEFWYPPRVST